MSRENTTWQLAFLHSLSRLHPTAILFLIVAISYLLGICDILHLSQYLRTMGRRPKDFDEIARAELEALNATFAKVGGKGMSDIDIRRRRQLQYREQLSKLSPDALEAKRSLERVSRAGQRKKYKAAVDEKVCMQDRNVFSHSHSPYTIVTHTPLSHPQRFWPPTYDFPPFGVLAFPSEILDTMLIMGSYLCPLHSAQPYLCCRSILFYCTTAGTKGSRRC
jgi:hypothetical protein